MIYEQSNLDGLAVSEHQGRLQFIVHEYPDTAASELDRDAVLRLYAALGEYLYPTHTPEGANRSLIKQLIDKAAQNAVAAILPYHLAPAADRWGYVDANRPTDGEDAPELCSISGCMATGMPGTHYAHDPAPRDVGHPDPIDEEGDSTKPADPFKPFTSCNCHDADGNSLLDKTLDERIAAATVAGRWEAELRRDAGKSIPLPYCGACGHSRIRHDSGRCSVRHCLCNWDGKP